jgi:DNA-binding NarL/FixJ family response regulator
VTAADGDVAAAIEILNTLDLSGEPTLPLEVGFNWLAKGRLLRRAKQRRAAADALREAVAIFECLGAVTWVDRGRDELGLVGSRRRAADELTAAELRVAELAATGITNREIARAAFMSEKTVEAHMGRTRCA